MNPVTFHCTLNSIPGLCRLCKVQLPLHLFPAFPGTTLSLLQTPATRAVHWSSPNSFYCQSLCIYSPLYQEYIFHSILATVTSPVPIRSSATFHPSQPSPQWQRIIVCVIVCLVSSVLPPDGQLSQQCQPHSRGSLSNLVNEWMEKWEKDPQT